MFLRLVERMLALQPVLPQPRQDGDRDQSRNRDRADGVDREVPDAG